MAADLQLIRETWNALQPFVRQEKCAGCECLHGALVELRMALEETLTGSDQATLLSLVRGAMGRGEPHACLGCEPCTPGDLLTAFYREQQAQATPAACACEDG
jgi:hypothetical protein